MFWGQDVFTLQAKLLRLVSRKLDLLQHGADFEAAIVATEFGRFHYCLIAICGLIYADTAFGVTIVSFVLPAATCDFDMTSKDKGWLIAAPMLGMVFGSYFWACLADTKGRKMVMVSTLLIDGFCGIISSFIPILTLFIIFRFISAFSLAGAMGLCFPYLGEFQSTKYREKILCWMELFWTFGVILLPLIAWAIIPIQGIRVEYGIFSYDSWNLFVAICSLPSIILGFWLLTFPESPKFMMECGDYDDALECFQKIYKMNTGNSPENYPIKKLKPILASHSPHSSKSMRYLSLTSAADLNVLMKQIWNQTQDLCKSPYLRDTILTSVIQFGVTTSYFTLMIWFPELFNRYTEFEKKHPGQGASICEISSIQYEEHQTEVCDSTIDKVVYINTLIIGIACIPTSLWLPLCVHRLGAKFFMIFTLTAAGFSAVGLYFVKNSTQNLVLSCAFEALTSVASSLLFCVLVDLFPTHLRVMAAAISTTVGRLGGLVGNLSFGYLVDLHCVVPIIIFSAFLFISAGLCLLLPTTGRDILI